jgi:hypothetical protein
MPRLSFTVVAFGVLVAAPAARATVIFQNTGTKAGWDSNVTQHIGTITDVPNAYRGPTALRMDQTFQGFDGYHSEVRKHDIQQPGQELYYGEALQLPSNWIFHDQNVTFEQFAQTDVLGSPWILMFVQNDHLFVAHVVNGSGTTDLGPITGLQGTWIRIVIHFKLGAAGLFEVWVNGMKRASLSGNIQAPNKGAIRWSVGMYCTYWRREQPKGLNPMVLFHDQMRVATTFEEADPASWNDNGAPPPPAADAGAADAVASEDGGATGDASAGTADAGGGGEESHPDAGMEVARPVRPPAPAPDADGEDPGVPTGGSTGQRASAGSGGCRYGGSGSGPVGAAPAVAVGIAFLRRRRRAVLARALAVVALALGPGCGGVPVRSGGTGGQGTAPDGVGGSDGSGGAIGSGGTKGSGGGGGPSTGGAGGEGGPSTGGAGGEGGAGTGGAPAGGEPDAGAAARDAANAPADGAAGAGGGPAVSACPALTTGWTSYQPAKTVQFEGGDSFCTYSDTGGVELFKMTRNPAGVRQRCEARVHNDYQSGTNQFEGDLRVTAGDGTCVHQVFKFLMLVAYPQNGGELHQHSQSLLASGIFGKWVHVNTIHDVATGKVDIYLDCVKKLTIDQSPPTGAAGWYDKYGVYNLGGPYAQSEWKNIHYYRNRP